MNLTLPAGAGVRADALLFGEFSSKVVASLPDEKLGVLEALAKEEGVPLAVIGRVEGSSLIVTLNGQKLIDRPVDGLFKVWRESLPCLMD